MTREPSEDPPLVFTQADLERIQSETWVQQVEHRHDLPSTNDLALELAGDQGRLLPLLVLAESQTAGRGRRANRWWSAQGALTFSLLLDDKTARLSPARWPQVSLTAGLAVCEALEQLLGEVDIGLKWPNDVYVQRRKVSGILLEAPRQQPGKLVLGIGINVNNSLIDASPADIPDDLSEVATALCDVAGRPFSLVDVLIKVLCNLERRLDWIGLHDCELRNLWRERCLLTDRRVQVETVAKRLVGLCQGIDEAGALLLQTEEGMQRCFSGTVTLIEHE